ILVGNWVKLEAAGIDLGVFGGLQKREQSRKPDGPAILYPSCVEFDPFYVLKPFQLGWWFLNLCPRIFYYGAPIFTSCTLLPPTLSLHLRRHPSQRQSHPLSPKRFFHCCKCIATSLPLLPTFALLALPFLPSSFRTLAMDSSLIFLNSFSAGFMASFTHFQLMSSESSLTMRKIQAHVLLFLFDDIEVGPIVVNSQ
ncbi:hypothetical protein Gohar_000677, partial [Gossypium harknessii]|nr:hypothetical protein [Gossypium harknessii]